jgi:hypothetical protein
MSVTAGIFLLALGWFWGGVSLATMVATTEKVPIRKSVAASWLAISAIVVAGIAGIPAGWYH